MKKFIKDLVKSILNKSTAGIISNIQEDTEKNPKGKFSISNFGIETLSFVIALGVPFMVLTYIAVQTGNHELLKELGRLVLEVCGLPQQ